jgi:hypothetical protein
MTTRTPNDTYVRPAEYAGPVDVARDQRPLNPEELLKDRQALSDEASKYAISKMGPEEAPPLSVQTEQEIAERRAAELSPEAKELQRVSSSLRIMEDKQIDTLFSRQGLKDFSFSNFDISALSSVLVGRKPSDAEREKVRRKLIEQETMKSPKVFQLDPDITVPDDQIWQLQHIDGHFFWFIHNKTSQNAEPAAIVHFSPTSKGIEKTVKFADEADNRHVPVSAKELQKLIQLFNSYENVVAQDIYFKVAGKHHGTHPA